MQVHKYITSVERERSVMPRARFILIAGLFSLSMLGVIMCGNALAAHFYIQYESNEEFHKITSTIEAKVESNGTIEFVSDSVRVLCYMSGEEKLFTNGEDEMTNIIFSSCSSGLCLVKHYLTGTSPANEIDYTELGEYGSPVTYTDGFEPGYPYMFEVVFELSGAGCATPGEYAVATNPENCETEVDNTIDLELIFPEKPRRHGCWNATYERIAGRLRVVPKVGRALRVGP